MLSINNHSYEKACCVEAGKPHVQQRGVTIFPEPVRRAIASFFKKIAAKRRLARSRSTLRNLNDHLLADIGLERRNVLRDRDVLRAVQRSFRDEYRRLGQ